MTKIHLFILRELSVFMSKVEIHFICKEMEFWTSFISPKSLNSESFSCAGVELDDFSLIVILVKIED